MFVFQSIMEPDFEADLAEPETVPAAKKRIYDKKHRLFLNLLHLLNFTIWKSSKQRITVYNNLAWM